MICDSDKLWEGPEGLWSVYLGLFPLSFTVGPLNFSKHYALHSFISWYDTAHHILTCVYLFNWQRYDCCLYAFLFQIPDVVCWVCTLKSRARMNVNCSQPLCCPWSFFSIRTFSSCKVLLLLLVKTQQLHSSTFKRKTLNKQYFG